MNTIIIRHAQQSCLAEIISIYNQAVAAGFQTADTEPWVAEDKLAWFQLHQNPQYPIFVAIENELVVGWAVISAYRPGRGALSKTKEISYYVHRSHLRKGIGTKLLKFAIDNAAVYNAETLIAILLDVNTPSIKLLENSGFSKWGHLPNVADFNGVKCGHFYYGLAIP